MNSVSFKLFNDRTFSDCFLNFAGHEQCEPGHSFGPAIRPCYIIHFILSGKGKFFCDNVEYNLGANQAFLIEQAYVFIARKLQHMLLVFDFARACFGGFQKIDRGVFIDEALVRGVLQLAAALHAGDLIPAAAKFSDVEIFYQRRFRAQAFGACAQK